MLDALKSIIKSVPKTRFSKPRIDSDESIMNPLLSGRAAIGGELSNEPMVTNKILKINE